MEKATEKNSSESGGLCGCIVLLLFAVVFIWFATTDAGKIGIQVFSYGMIILGAFGFSIEKLAKNKGPES